MRLFRKILIILLIGFGFWGCRWYLYISNTESLYGDELGVEMNARLPQPLRRYGCYRLHETFGDVFPPYGCRVGPDHRDWL